MAVQVLGLVGCERKRLLLLWAALELYRTAAGGQLGFQGSEFRVWGRGHSCTVLAQVAVRVPGFKLRVFDLC